MKWVDAIFDNVNVMDDKGRKYEKHVKKVDECITTNRKRHGK